MSQNQYYPALSLKQGKDEALKRFHPWVFSGAVKQLPANIKPGDLVSITAEQGKIIATGSFEGGTIAVKVLSFANVKIDEEFFITKLKDALHLRKALGIANNQNTNAWRLVHSEGDHLPGLIVDIYGQTAVIQTQSAGMGKLIDVISKSLIEVLKHDITAVYHKNTELNTSTTSKSNANKYVFGEKPSSNTILENGIPFYVDWEKGQKTGFFLDQRDARQLLGRYSNGRKALNTFSYSGGFSVFALHHGASHVVSVDSSATAIALCNANVHLNQYDDRHHSVCMDAKKYLEEMEYGAFDLIVLDPPAFAKNHHNRHKGILGYKYINQTAIRKISPGGILFTFSCSQAVDRASFQSILMASALETGRKVQILHQLSQPADHPVNLYHSEGSYLKGLVLRIL
jgi:23S rRNA (cytosine1962-C5)-methyltransferase